MFSPANSQPPPSEQGLCKQPCCSRPFPSQERCCCRMAARELPDRVWPGVIENIPVLSNCKDACVSLCSRNTKLVRIVFFRSNQNRSSPLVLGPLNVISVALQSKPEVLSPPPLHFKVDFWPKPHLYRLMCSYFHSPDAADSSTFDVQLGDIILTATDGLFDNMPDYMILQELKKLKVTRNVKTVALAFCWWHKSTIVY